MTIFDRLRQTSVESIKLDIHYSVAASNQDNNYQGTIDAQELKIQKEGKV